MSMTIPDYSSSTLLFSSSSSRFLAETADGEEHFGVHISYADIYAGIVFLAAIYASGIFTVRFLAMPALVGEIFMGIVLGPNLANIVPNVEAFVMLGEIGLILLVLEAGIDIDLTTIRLIGTRGLMIALIGTFLPIGIAFSVAQLLGYTGVAAIAAGCTFAPTSLGIAMNVLRRSNIVNTPVGQLIVAAAIIDDMVALVILSQLQAFAGDEVTILGMLIPVFSALGFLIIGGALAVFVLPQVLNWLILDRLDEVKSSREWMSLAIMFTLLLLLIPATYFAKASPLMGAFLAGLVFCNSADVHHMFVSQFKRVMQWLLRIFFAASIGFQVPVQQFGSGKVILQGLLFTLALLGKVVVGFMAPNFSPSRKFKGLHLRDCLVVGFSMAAEGEFAFVIAVFGVTHNMITQDLYASVVLAVLLSTILSPFLLRFTISHFNKQIESTMHDAIEHDADAALEKGIREETAVFLCIQIESAPAWGLQTTISSKLAALDLDVIDHRSWHPRQSTDTLVNEIYVRDADDSLGSLDGVEVESRVTMRIDEIAREIKGAIGQADAVIKVQRWLPEMPEEVSLERSISEHIVRATGTALEQSMKENQRSQESEKQEYLIMMEDDVSSQGKSASGASRKFRKRQVKHLSAKYKGKLEGLFRHDRSYRKDQDTNKVHAVPSEDGIELLDVHGFGTGHNEIREQYDVHGTSLT